MIEEVRIGEATLYHGDCREVLPDLVSADLVVTDPPYGDTSLSWDKRAEGWLQLIHAPQLWCFGSLRFWMASSEFTESGWKYAQEVVWEKHNGSSFHADRFKRVHELIVHWYKGAWNKLYRDVPTSQDATSRAVRRKRRPPHTGSIEASAYQSNDGGPRLMRSVQLVRSCHGYAQHPTQKPTQILEPLISMSCPNNGLVLDPFMGSGSTGVACRNLGRRFIGIEEIREHFDTACERIEAAYSQGRLFA